jgi:type I restriction enzyme S subunit
MVASATFDEIKKFRILRGDVLITKDSEEWDDIAVPSFIKEILETVLCGYHLALVRPKAGMIDGKYLFRTFQSYIVNSQFRISVNGITRYGLSRNSIASAFFPVPPLLEQQAIANFLDHKTAKIDESIKNIKSQIEKLKEYHQTLISNVVTGKVRVN